MKRPAIKTFCALIVMILTNCGLLPEVKEQLYDRQFDGLPAAKHMETATAETIKPYEFPTQSLEETQAAGDALRDK